MVAQRISIFRTVLLILAISAAAVSGKIIYVDGAAEGLNDGSTWQNAYNFVQDAMMDANDFIVDANSVVEIRVAQGIYTPDANSTAPQGTGSRYATFGLGEGITLKGGYAGNTAAVPSERDVRLYETILSGDLAGDDARFEDPCDMGSDPNRNENSYHVLGALSVHDDARLDGFTITGGHADGADESTAGRSGAGIYMYYSEPEIINCTFRNNWAAGIGAAINCENYCSPVITNCTFERNYAQSRGGAISLYTGSATVTDCDFIKNGANGGGAVQNNYLTRITETFYTNCTFSRNEARRYGGAMYNYNSNPYITNCLFEGNVVHSTVDGVGGATANMDSEVIFSNCTIVGNRAPVSGSAMECYLGEPGLVNSIVWDNAPAPGGVLGGQSGLWAGYSVIQGGFDGYGVSDSDPLFAAGGQWDNNGTPQDVNDDVWIAGDYHLKSTTGRWDPNSGDWVADLVDSPCIDTGFPEDEIRFEVFPHGQVVNMGVYGGTEQASMSKCPVGNPADTTNDGKVNLDDLVLLFERWLEQDPPMLADVDRNGTIDFADLALMNDELRKKDFGDCRRQVFSDSFENGEWDGLWTEDDQRRWSTSRREASLGSFAARVRGRAENTILTSREIDLGDFTCATVWLSWFIESNFEPGDYVAFEVSTDGGATWTEKARLEGDAAEEDIWLDDMVSLKDVQQLQIRLRATISSIGKDAYVDNIAITGSYH